jgi:hypothetical protein
MAIMLMAVPAFAAQPAAAQANCRTFTQTAQTVCNQFLAYWDNNGGLAQQGFPITGVLSEVSDTDGKTYTVQYFERAVFELHPEFANTPNEVLLQLLGVYFWNRRYPTGAPGQVPNAEPGARLFPETGKTLGGTFQRYWDTHGGLRQQGFPISNEFIEVNDLDGKPYKVQYFERAVFELHPEFAGTPNEVLLSQVGTFAERIRHAGPVPPTQQPPSVPTPTRPAQPTTPPPPPAATSTPVPTSGCAALPPANPNVISIPASRCGPGGTVFGWTAGGFQPNELVGVYITLPDGSVFGAPFQVDTDGEGNVIGGVSFQTASNFPTGVWAITFEGVDSHITQIEHFAITP